MKTAEEYLKQQLANKTKVIEDSRERIKAFVDGWLEEIVTPQIGAEVNNTERTFIYVEIPKVTYTVGYDLRQEETHKVINRIREVLQAKSFTFEPCQSMHNPKYIIRWKNKA